MSLRSHYIKRYNGALLPLAARIEAHLTSILSAEVRIDRITARAKSISRFIDKAGTRDSLGNKKYADPLSEIQDQVGARVVVFYLSDVDRVAERVERYFHHIEARDHVPDSQWEFGYFGRHYVLLFPSDIFDQSINKDDCPIAFELQIKTLFQHAWSEANHDLGYKPEAGNLRAEEVRKLAFASAQAWGADQIFDSFLGARREE
jgi:ppGpp synthetase/RelA/SpoT-type nucleotidyltranferase